MLFRSYLTRNVFLNSFQFNEEARSPFVKKYKTIIHPGEVCICICIFTVYIDGKVINWMHLKHV